MNAQQQLRMIAMCGALLYCDDDEQLDRALDLIEAFPLIDGWPATVQLGLDLEYELAIVRICTAKGKAYMLCGIPVKS